MSTVILGRCLFSGEKCSIGELSEPAVHSTCRLPPIRSFLLAVLVDVESQLLARGLLKALTANISKGLREAHLWLAGSVSRGPLFRLQRASRLNLASMVDNLGSSTRGKGLALVNDRGILAVEAFCLIGLTSISDRFAALPPLERSKLGG